MKFQSLCSKSLVYFSLFLAFLQFSFTGFGQIISYTSDTGGVLSVVATNATGTPLTRVNGALHASSPCSTGYSSRGFTNTTTYNTTLQAIEVDATPNSGYSLNVTGFSVGLRMSSTGPASIRFAYSVDGGTTWIDQGINQAPNNSSCGSTTTATWATTFTVASPNLLKFRLYGFNASGTTGNLQILNLLINGTVTTTGVTCVSPTLSDTITQVLCHGGSTGRVALGLTGGTSPFNYLWSNGATTSVISGVTAGTYTATVTATGGCTATLTATITQPTTALADSTTSIVNTTCSGLTGQATVVAYGGTLGYTYAWVTVPVQTTATATGLSAGTYSVTVIDAHGCTAMGTATISIAPTAGLLATSITTSGVELHWSPVAGAASYNIRYRITGTTTWSSTTSASDSIALSGLTAGTTYEFQVQVVCSGGSTSNYTSSTSFTTLSCATPTGISVTAITPTTAFISWSPVTGAASYVLGYRVSGTTTWINVPVTSDTITLTGLTAGTTYQYDVQTVCSGTSSSAYSTVATFTTTATPTCATPTGISVTAITPTTAFISWSPVTGAASYVLGYRVSGTTTWINVPVTSDTITLTGLTAGTTYQYDVQTVCSGTSSSAYSTVATFTTSTLPSCGTPTGLTATSITSSGAVLSWTAVTGATSYTIEYEAAGATSWTTVTSTTPTLTLTGLAFATHYTFKVQTVCSSGISSFSTTDSFTTLTCLIPSGLTISSITSTSAIIHWSAVSGAVSYTLGYRVSGSTTWHDTVVTGIAVTLSGLTAGTTYNFDLQTSCTGGGTSVWSSVDTFTTLPATSCSVPSGLAATVISSTSATLTWAAVPGAIGYHIMYRITSGTWIHATSVTNTITLTGLSSPATYNYSIMAICSSTDSSSYSSAATFATSLCVAPSSVAASTVTTISASVSWTPITGATSYNLSFRITGTTTWTTISVTSSPYLLTGLTLGTSYDFEIQTVCSSGGTSVYSSMGTFTTLTAITCGLVTGMISSSITTTSAVLSWTAVSGALSYSIQYRPVGTTTWTTTTSSTTSVTISGLTPSTVYEYQVKTICSSGTSAFTTSTNFTTLGTCGVPTGLTTGAITTTSATISWSAVTGALSYNIQYRVLGTTTWATTTSTTASKVLTGLTAGSTYEFQVQTVCSSGTSGYTISSLFTTTAATTTNKFLYYFTTPVDTNVRTGTPANYLNHCMADTLVAYISRARYTIDIAQYEYIQGTSYANIANAINTAYAHGVKIRWIYDGTATNTGLAALSSGINTLPSPTGSAYGIMHNKFMIIDAKSTNPNDAIVWTSSIDWTADHFNLYYNNTVIIQDSSLAHTYLNEFNMMWGDTGIAPNATLAKFGTFKTDLGHHIHTIGGKTVEVYFSPSDSTDYKVQSTINSAATDFYFSMYTFTNNTYATQIVSRHSAGVYVAGVDDVFSSTATPYTTFTSGLGSMFEVYNPSGSSSVVYHNKYCIADPSNTCSDPMVLTGSMNWSSAGYNLNDENTLIIHDATAANIYYQAFHHDFQSLGGTLTHPSATAGCNTIYLKEGHIAQSETTAENDKVLIYPNPSNEYFTIAYHLENNQNVTISISDYLGNNVMTPINDVKTDAGDHQYIFEPRVAGMYIIKMTIGNNVFINKMIKL